VGSFLRSQDGAVSIEYALIAVIIGTSLIGLLQSLVPRFTIFMGQVVAALAN
jgi:Flp pilus assembly pilin Flp